MGGNDNRQILADVYRASTDPAVKRSIIRSFMVSGDRARLLGLAKSETAPELRGEAVQQLGVMGAHAELAELYSTETSVDVKKRIIQAMFVGGNADKLIELAKTREGSVAAAHAPCATSGLMGASQHRRCHQGDLPVRHLAGDPEGSDQRAVPAEQRTDRSSSSRAPKRIPR